jgi:fibro-slime domain-containing protein
MFMTQNKHLIVTIRDFITKEETGKDGLKPHPDFEFKALKNGEKGIVKPKLKNGKPEFATPPRSDEPQRRTVHSADSFNSWFHDRPDFNVVKTDFELVLEPHPGHRPEEGVYRTIYGNPQEINRENFRDIDPSKMYFPIDNQMMGNEGREHNYHFTTELKPHKFTYKGTEKFTFIGDDDLWVYINGILVIDLGGTHVFQQATLDLSLKGNDTVFKQEFFGQTLELKKGETYDFVLFHAERHTDRSFFYFETSFDLVQPPTVRLSVPDPEAKEPSSSRAQPDPGMFRFSIVEKPGEPLPKEDLEILFSVSGKAKEGQDYVSFSRPVVIPAGKTSVDVDVLPIFDEELEGDEDVVVTLEDSDQYQRAMPYSGTVIIKDCEVCPYVSVEASVPKAFEPGFGQVKQNGVFTVSLSEPASKNLVIYYTVEASSTAEEGVDYKALSGSVTIPQGKKDVNIFVEPFEDDLKEADETVTITLKKTDDPKGNCYRLNPTGFKQTATVTIINPRCPVACIAASDPRAVEPGPNKPGDNGEFTITLDRPAWKNLTINLKPPTGDARPGIDYQTLPTQVTILKGDRQAKIPVIPIRDNEKERNERVLLSLAPGDGYEICDPARNSAVVVIIDCPPQEDLTVEIEATKPNACEPREAGDEAPPRDWGQFRISLSEPAPTNMKVRYGIQGRAKEGRREDYLLKDGRQTLGAKRRNNSVVFKKGDRHVFIDVVPLGDNDFTEGNENVDCQLQNGHGYKLGRKKQDRVIIKPFNTGPGPITGDRR